MKSFFYEKKQEYDPSFLSSGCCGALHIEDDTMLCFIGSQGENASVETPGIHFLFQKNHQTKESLVLYARLFVIVIQDILGEDIQREKSQLFFNDQCLNQLEYGYDRLIGRFHLSLSDEGLSYILEGLNQASKEKKIKQMSIAAMQQFIQEIALVYPSPAVDR